MSSRTSIRGKLRRIAGGTCVCALLFLAAVPGGASSVTVGCPGGSGGTYASIGAALAALAGTPGPNTITVTGTCTESNTVQDFTSLTIQAPSVGGATVVALPNNDGFDVSRSRDIHFRNLAVSGDSSTTGDGILVFGASEVFLDACTISGFLDAGLSINEDSFATVRGSVFQNNPGDGVDVVTGSTAAISDSTIRNNDFVGVVALDRSSVSFARQNLISGNGDTGIIVQDLSRATFNQRLLPTLQVTTVENNRFLGVLAAVQSIVRMNGQHKVRNNGCNNSPDCTLNLTGGVYLLRNSTMRGFGGLEISGNTGPGVTADQGIDAAFNDTKFANNTGDGLKILHISNGSLISGNTFSGNGGASFSCDATSLVSGDVSGISKSDCKQVERVNGPPRPGRFKEPNP